jgi:hypothetical protein
LVYLVLLLVPYIHNNPCNHAHACEQKHDSVMSVIGETRQFGRGCWLLDVVHVVVFCPWSLHLLTVARRIVGFASFR